MAFSLDENADSRVPGAGDYSSVNSSPLSDLVPQEITGDQDSPRNDGVTTLKAHFEEYWNRLQQQVLGWHFKPDLEALKIILAFEASYQISTGDHLWIHLIGPSSSGKTSLGIALLAGLYEDHHMLGEITPNTFLSGLTRGKQKGKFNSFLHQIGERGLVYAPDFTNFLSNDPQTVGKVAGQLREIYDGEASRRAGSMESANSWTGNIAMITAFTPSKESAWHMHNREGERFLTLRWRGVEPVGEEEEVEFGRVLKVTNDKKEKQGEMRAILKEWLEDGGDKVNWATDKVGLRHGLSEPSTATVEDKSYRLAKLVGLLRTLPTRPDGRTISHISGIEGPGRVFKQLVKVARGWASICRRTTIDSDDWKLAERLAVDSIPETRRWILENLSWSDGVSKSETLLEMTPFENKDALEWHLNDLHALKVIWRTSFGEIGLTQRFVELAESGAGGWVGALREGHGVKVEEARERSRKRELEGLR